ncbi:MAG: hypothetical protein VX641_03265 [Planctomycetota bacterium]|nr:hypothetical protein [Planctomycetota bacterium]
MRPLTLTLLAGFTLLLTACAHNQWWEAERSGWVLYGRNVEVPRKARPVPLNLLPEASTWASRVYVEAWIDSVDQEHGEWAMISDGTSVPVLVLMDGGFTIPRNARGRRILAWGSPLVAEGSVRTGDETPRRNVSLDFAAEAVLIQGFYGLEPAPRPRMTDYAPEHTAEPIDLPEDPQFNEDPAADESITTESTPAGIVDLPD